MKKLIVVLLIAFSGLSLAGCSKEQDIKNKVVKIVGNGQCTGEQVKAPSGVTYILTAAHCAGIADNGVMRIIKEDGTELLRKVIVESPEYDLMLLEGLPNVDGLEIGDELSPGDHVRSFTHGGGRDTFRTQGEVVQHADGSFAMPEDDKCDLPKNKKAEIDFFGLKFEVCLVKQTVLVVTAQSLPGSSGGPMVDDKGRLIGVVSVGMNNGFFTGLVPVENIKKFLSGY